MEKQTNLLRQLARSRKHPESCIIESILSDDITVQSPWVLGPVKGKNSFIAHHKVMFKAIQRALNTKHMNVPAEFDSFPHAGNKPCITLTKQGKKIILKATVWIKIRDDGVYNIGACLIPDPTGAKPRGDTPVQIIQIF